MKVCFSRSRSPFSSTFFLHTHTQSFKTLISFPTLIQKNTPGGTNFERKNHPPFLHYWLTFRIESDKLVGFSIFLTILGFFYVQIPSLGLILIVKNADFLLELFNLDIWLVSSHFKICSSNRIFHHTLHIYHIIFR